jgi:hypothetical protein
MIKFKSKHN